MHICYIATVSCSTPNTWRHIKLWHSMHNSLNLLWPHSIVSHDWHILAPGTRWNKSAPKKYSNVILSHWGHLTRMCVIKLGHYWFSQWPIPYAMPSHFQNQCWLIFNWIHRYTFQWSLNQTTLVFIQENTFQNVLCKMADILSRPQCVKRNMIYYTISPYIHMYATYHHILFAEWDRYIRSFVTIGR